MDNNCISTSPQVPTSELMDIVATIKTAIMRSRYYAAKSVNRHALTLYFLVGEYISNILASSNWGDGIIDQISKMLRQELPGLRGFSSANIRKMKSFYNTWKSDFEFCSLSTNNFSEFIKHLNTNNLSTPLLQPRRLSDQEFEAFMSVGFTHHYEIASKGFSLQDRMFYIRKCASEFWSVKRLQLHIKEQLHKSVTIKSHSFNSTITDKDLRSRALRAFKDEYLLDLVNLEDYDPDDIDERILEYEIVHNIKSFIMAFGQDFAFMGNQYRLEVDGEELFIDLLFYHRGLRCLVAVELKTGKFKGAYAGQLNTYLSALDDLIRRPDENPSIGLILCKEKSDKMVEYAFRNTTTPMGVATYTLTSKLPPKYTNALPNPKDLVQLLKG